MREAAPTKRLDTLSEGLEAAGFFILDVVSAGRRTDIAVGSAGQAFWSQVSQSHEWRSGQADPIDTYTKRQILSLIREDKGEEVIFVFDPDAPNFVKLWTGVFPKIAQSSLGPMIHPDYGLWMGARAHIILPEAYFKFEASADFDPCPSCEDKPCLSACPVEAFRGPQDYDVQTCARYLESKPRCFSGGCDARAACPFGQTWRLPKDQAEYHQQKLIGAFG